MTARAAAPPGAPGLAPVEFTTYRQVDANASFRRA